MWRAWLVSVLYYDHVCGGVRLHHAHMYSQPLQMASASQISHSSFSVCVLLFYLSFFLPHTGHPVNLQLAIQTHLTEYGSLVCVLWLYDRVFVGLIAGPHLNLHAHGHCWGRNEPHSCHALSFMTKTHRFPSPLQFPPCLTPSNSTQISFSLV